MNVKKKTYSGIFRDGGAGKYARRRYRLRREQLMQRENRLMVITGVPYGPGGETVWAYAHCPTYQEPALMYLTGVNQTRVVLLLDPHSPESDEILFIDRKDPHLEFWNGIRFGVGDDKSVKEAARVTGIRDIRDIGDLKKVLHQRLARCKNRVLGTLWMEGVKKGRPVSIPGDHNALFRAKLARWLRAWGGEPPVNIMKSHFELRLPLDRYDVANVHEAQRITGEAFKETLRRFHTLKNECEVQGTIEGEMLKRSPYGLSFPSIVASGPNATVLHYMKNDDEFGRGELVLIDFGVRWMTMHADISRTVPASGRFNPMQKVLYEIVLKAQRAVEEMACEGVTIEELNDCCWNAVEAGLKKDFLDAGGRCKLRYKGRPHGVSHLMGEQEHDGDPFRNYAEQPMRAGWQISNEPGLYGAFRMRVGGRFYDEEIGIRIEDNLLITKTGCVNFSGKIPKTVSAIERMMRPDHRKKA
ncbi:MAG: aminopeptidase P family protein [Nitrospinaceae bacterium]|nr:MAG: aminopeptidase P family protein [Nitrospinaceae bacterium]